MKLPALLLAASPCFVAQDVATSAEEESLRALAAEAERLVPLVDTPLARALLGAVENLPPVAPTTIYRASAGGYLAPAYTEAEYEALSAPERVDLTPQSIDTRAFYYTFYGSPLASIRAFDWAALHGLERLDGARICDFGFGSVGQLRLLAACGAEVVGTEVMPALRAIYAVPEAQGAVRGDDLEGTVRLLFGRWPAEPALVRAVGEGLDLFVSKNTIKRGYLDPPVEIAAHQRMELGVEPAEFLDALRRALRPGGLVVFYNLGGAPAPEGEPYRPAADIATPWSPAEYEAHGFEVLAHDRDDSDRARAFGRALGWDESMALDTELFARVTILRRASPQAGEAR